METAKTKAKLNFEINWHVTEGLQRSSVVMGFQAEIKGTELTIYNRYRQYPHNGKVSSNPKTARSQATRMIEALISYL